MIRLWIWFSGLMAGGPPQQQMMADPAIKEAAKEGFSFTSPGMYLVYAAIVTGIFGVYIARIRANKKDD